MTSNWKIPMSRAFPFLIPYMPKIAPKTMIISAAIMTPKIVFLLEVSSRKISEFMYP